MNTDNIQVEVVIPTQTKYLELIGQIGEQIVQKIDVFALDADKETLAYQLNLVLTEATANAIKHGHHNNPQDTVKITIHLQNNALTVKVYDHGTGFDLKTVLSPDFEHPKENGMGLFLIRTLMDSVTYTRTNDGNVLEIIKYLRSTHEQSTCN